jgi:hypothetical protein
MSEVWIVFYALLVICNSSDLSLYHNIEYQMLCKLTQPRVLLPHMFLTLLLLVLDS